MKIEGIFVSILIVLISVMACQKNTKPIEKTPTGKLAYDLDNFDKKHFLPEDLEEISGIAYYKPHHIACVQDEEGKVYIYNLERKKITQYITFGKSGDYEDIALNGSQAYVIKSNGKIYTFEIENKRKVEAKVLETTLSLKNDVEGLALDFDKKNLLLACKGRVDKGKKGSEKMKAIYSYSLDNQELNPKPRYLIDLDKLKDFLKDKDLPEKKKFTFKPSGICVHPIDKKIYLIASEGNLLLVLNEDGSFFEAAYLPPKIYKQPEGICFAPNGDMYVSSEGRTGDGYILKFSYLKK